jgi:hypothetical protein
MRALACAPSPGRRKGKETMTGKDGSRRWTQRVLAAMVIALAQAPPARACDLCAIYTGSLMRQEKTGLYVAASEQFTSFGTIREDRRSVPNPGNEWVRSSITQLAVGWQALPWLGVQANLPLISREYQRLEDGVATRGDANGAGDLSLLARVSPVSRAVGETLVHVELMAGLKTPTGDTDRLAEELGDHHEEEEEGGHAVARSAVTTTGDSAPFSRRAPRHGPGHGDPSAVHGHDLSPGSGSVDGVFGVSLYADWKRLFTHASVQYVVRGNGDFGYEYANDLTWEVSPGFYVVADHPWTAAARIAVSGENKGRDHQGGALVDDTALTAVYVGPGLTMTLGHSLHADLTVDLPVLQDTTGRQIVADYRLRFGASWRF